jgi:ElaB/YqjD/DUF883 family membrane-anchored ribosome-binding protein
VPSVAKPLTDKLMAAVHKVLKANKSELTDKMQKVVNKSIKKIVKNTDKQIQKALTAQ